MSVRRNDNSTTDRAHVVDSMLHHETGAVGRETGAEGLDRCICCMGNYGTPSSFRASTSFLFEHHHHHHSVNVIYYPFIYD